MKKLSFSLLLSSLLFSSQGYSQGQYQNTVSQKSTKKTFAPVKQRCDAKKPWNDKNIAKWLNVSIEEIKQVKLMRSLDNQAFCTLPAVKLAHAFEKAANPTRPDKPDLAMQFRMEQLSVNGIVKPDGLINAIKELKNMTPYFPPSFLKKNKLLIGKEAKTVSVTRDNWVPLGPGNVGGRIRTLFIHPQDHNLLFAGSVGGGIWKSTDGGVSWSVVDDFMANLAVTSIVADPRTTDEIKTTVLYASTGEGFYNIDALRGYGLFKSIDGGETWEQVTSTDPTTEDSDWYFINRIAINEDGVIIAVARSNAIFTSNDDAQSWSKSEPGPHYYSMMYDVKFDPNDKTKAIVGSINGDCYYSTNSGQDWNSSNIVDASSSWLSGRVEVTYATSENKIYACVDNNDGEIYESTDGGATWTYLSNPQHLHGQGWYNNTIWVDPTDASHLVIGGLDLHRSTDGGETWNKISTWYYAPASPHADNHAIISDPGFDGINNLQVFIANDGGLYKAEDINQTDDSSSNNGWETLNHGLGVTQFYCAAGIPGSKITAGAQDNGTQLNRDENQSSWDKIYGGDGGFSAVSKQSEDGKFYYFGEYVYLKIHRSDDGGHSEYIYENGLDDAGTNANFIAPFTMDPNDNNTMLAGGASLWKSNNVSTADADDITWTKIKDEVDGTKISQITVADGNSDLILVGYNNGEIYKTTNGTDASPTWTKIHDSVNKHVLSLLIDKDNHDIFYAGWGGFDSENLQKSEDGGNSWSDLADNLPQVPIRAIERHPTRSDYLYVGTEIGLFTSEDQGASWNTVRRGPANVSIEKLFWHDDETLVAATHGRGVFKAKIELDPCEEVRRSLNAYHWTIVSFPCDTGNNGIEALLGNALGTYGNEDDWVMYEQTGENNYTGSTVKRMLEANDTVEPGKGYWIITATDRNMTIDHTLSGLSFTSEQNASDLNINDDDFATVHRRQLPDSDEEKTKKVMLGNPFPRSMQLNDIYFSHNNADSDYNPMSNSDDSDENPNAPYIKGTIYTFNKQSTSNLDYKAISPDTPGFTDTIDPMTGFFIILKSGETGSNYMAFPYEK